MDPRRSWAIDQYQWGRVALTCVDLSVEEHELVARKVGSSVAAEILLQAVAETYREN